MKNDFFNVRALSLHPSPRPKTKDLKSIQPKFNSKEKKGIQILLDGSSKSHCNTFVGYSRIPHKYDHFHEKTFSNTFMSSIIYNPISKPSEPEVNLISLSEVPDVSQAISFFSKQQAYNKVFELNKLNLYQTRKKGNSNRLRFSY